MLASYKGFPCTTGIGDQYLAVIDDHVWAPGVMLGTNHNAVSMSVL